MIRQRRFSSTCSPFMLTNSNQVHLYDSTKKHTHSFTISLTLCWCHARNSKQNIWGVKMKQTNKKKSFLNSESIQYTHTPYRVVYSTKWRKKNYTNKRENETKTKSCTNTPAKSKYKRNWTRQKNGTERILVLAQRLWWTYAPHLKFGLLLLACIVWV